MERLVLSLPHKVGLAEVGKKRYILALGYAALALNPISLLYNYPPVFGIGVAAFIFLCMLILGGNFCKSEAIRGLVKVLFWVGVVLILFAWGQTPYGAELGNRIWFVLLFTQPLLAIYDTLQLVKGYSSLYFHIKAR